LLVLDGRPIALDAQLARLDASARAVLGAGIPADLRAAVVDHARGAARARLRLDLTPAGSAGPATAMRLTPVDDSMLFPGPDRALDLARVVVPGGLGAHKWADRDLVTRAEARLQPRVPLLVDDDGTVLEGSRANVFVVIAGALLTPPADGRILPGVTRRRVLDLAAEAGIAAREEVVGPRELASAQEVFLTGAVRGIEPVRSCDGQMEWGSGTVTATLAARLRRAWARDAATLPDVGAHARGTAVRRGSATTITRAQGDAIHARRA
jgi:para-aminobenzoate synthetase/4-amino-4-deoxychorismate lyase